MKPNFNGRRPQNIKSAISQQLLHLTYELLGGNKRKSRVWLCSAQLVYLFCLAIFFISLQSNSTSFTFQLRGKDLRSFEFESEKKNGVLLNCERALTISELIM
jgi:hypothetical protein